MKSPLSRHQAKAFIKRWKLVNSAEIEELKKTSYSDKFFQLASLIDSVKPMGWDRAVEEEVDAVRARWAALRGAHRGAK